MSASGFQLFRSGVLINLLLYVGALGSSAQAQQSNWNEESIYELNQTAEDLIESRNFQEAKAHIDQALIVSRQANSFKGEAQALLNLGTYYETRGIPDSTIVNLEGNLDRFMDSDITIRLGNMLGNAYMTTGQYQKGLEIYLEMLKLAEKHGEERLRLGITLNLGNSYNTLGDLPYAIDSFLDALELAEERQDTTIIALALNNLAAINTRQQNYELALAYLTRSLNLNIESGDIRNQITNHVGLGTLYKQLQNFEMSYNNYHDGLQLATDNEILLPKIQILYNLGSLYYEFDHLEQARNYFEESFRLSQENNIRNGYFFNQLQLGSVYEKMGDFPMALQLYKEALLIADKTGAVEHIQQTLQSLYNLSTAVGDTSQAFTYLQRYSTINDSLAQTRREEALARQEAALGFRLEQENRMALETAYQNEQRNFLVAVLLMVLFMLLLAVTVLFYKKKKDINELLSKRTEELIRVNHLKDSLLSVLAHDLRTPLSNLSGVVFLIRKKALEGEDINEALDDIDIKLQQGVRTLTNYLQWAQSQWDGKEVKLTPLNVREQIESMLDEFSAMAKLKNISFNIDVDDYTAVNADSQLLAVILRNLLINAIKFTHQNGSITIHSERYTDDRTNISITDNGTGIRPEKLKDLFKPMTYSVEGTEGEEGTGLGLFICKDFAEKQNGTITVHSIYGEGSTFTIQLESAINLETAPREEEVIASDY